MHLSFPAHQSVSHQFSLVSVLLSALSLYFSTSSIIINRAASHTCSLFYTLPSRTRTDENQKVLLCMVYRGAAFSILYLSIAARRKILFLAALYLAECFLAHIVATSSSKTTLYLCSVWVCVCKMHPSSKSISENNEAEKCDEKNRPQTANRVHVASSHLD